MTKVARANTVTVTQLWRSLSGAYLARRDTELLEMTRARSHSYTSLRDVVARSLPPPSSSSSSSSSSSRYLTSHPSLPVHMRNPLVEKAARAYLASAPHPPHAAHPSSGLSAGLSSLFKLVRFPFLTTHRGFASLFAGFSWLKQLSLKL